MKTVNSVTMLRTRFIPFTSVLVADFFDEQTEDFATVEIYKDEETTIEVFNEVFPLSAFGL